jgi:UDP-glucose 4-epimerase
MSQIKKVLVTGGAGFVGTNLIKRLLKDGYEVVSIDNYYTGKKENHQKGCKYEEYDVTTITDYSAFGKFDMVYHLAAIARIQPSFDEPDKCFKVNSLGTFNVAMFCSKYNIPMLYAGSSSHHSGRYKNPYTFTKDVGEDIVLMFQKIYGLKASISRFYNVYGPYHLKEGAYCTVMGIWETAIENKLPLLITGDGSKRRDFTHVNDIVDALVKIYEKQKWGHVFELGTGTNHSIKEVAEMFKYENIKHIDSRPGEAEVTLCTDTLANELLDWIPTHTLVNYINDYIKK